MKALLLKEFYTMKNSIILSAVLTAGIMTVFLTLLGTVGARNGDIAVFLFGSTFLIITIISSVMITGTFQNDEKSGWMQYALATPVSRKQYLNSKYLFQLIAGLTGSICSACFLILCYLITGSFNAGVLLWVLFWIAMGTAISMIIGIWYISLMTKYTYAKASGIVIAIFMSLFFLLTALAVITYGVLIPVADDHKDMLILINFIVRGLIILIPIAFLTSTGILFYKSYRWIAQKEI